MNEETTVASPIPEAAAITEQAPPVRLGHAPTPENVAKYIVTPAMRQTAVDQATALVPSAVTTEAPTEAPVNLPAPNSPPDYFGPYPNYANSPLPTIDPVTQKVVAGTGMRKFFDSLAGVGPSNANNLHNYIPLAAPDTITHPGYDYYEIALKRYTQKMSSDLPPTTLQGYVQLNNGTDAGGHNTIVPPPKPYYLGPMIIAKSGRPVRVKFTNMLPIGSGGNLFLPVDPTLCGAGTGPLGGTTNYPQNRATLHLHGGRTPWISDGTPYQWITPANEITPYPKGVSAQNVPDVPDPGPGAMTFFYTNQQSARLMWIHDHSIGITRLNVYSGEALPYELQDPVERALVAAGTIPAGEMPLIIQDKTFVPGDVQLTAQDPTWDKTKWGGLGSLWFPHVYMPNQNPGDITGVAPMGRWDYGPWFWPPVTTLTQGPIPNPYYDPVNAPWEPPLAPGTPTPTQVPEAFLDTPLVNGTPYPTFKVQRKAYRFRILNASNDRTYNLQLYYAKSNATMWNGNGTLNNADAGEVPMVEACYNPTYPPTWPTDGRAGGVPDPTASGPEMIQIGNDAGFLPAPVVLPNQPINYQYNRRDIVVLNVTDHTLLMGPAERADIIIDFSQVPAGSKIILYNDAPAPVPAFDPRYDYYTGDPDQVSTGGTESTQPGYGPNTRTILQFDVQAGTPAPAFDLAALQAQLPVAYGQSQPPPIVPEQEYDPPFGTTTAVQTYARIQDTSLDWAGLPKPMPMQPKAIQELFDDWGRMNSTLGTELPFTNIVNQTTLPLKYLDPPTEIIEPSVPGTQVGSLNDGTQIWKVTHNGVDTHFIHFHLFDVQLINRVGWDGAIRPPDPNELGWKDTVRMNPLEDTIVAMRPMLPTLPFKVPDSVRAYDPTSALGTTSQFTGVNPDTGQPMTVVNELYNFGWEYVWHCHILGHEENDMMRPVVFQASPAAPTNLAATVLTATSVKLTWTNNATYPAATDMYIQRATNAAFTQNLQTFTTLGTATTYTDSTVASGTTYHYRVRAENSVSYSAWSNAVTVQAAPPPAPPTNLVATPFVTPTQASMFLSWAEPFTSTVTGFTVQLATNAAFTTGLTTVTVSAATRSYYFAGLVAHTVYYLRVQALNGSATSAWTTVTAST
jgi:FtsP/CotA-like multicopper oxidase with cupredoxin domain